MKPLLFIILFSYSFFLNCQEWKDMSSNYDINLYDVVESAESYFENIDISKKGSGWKKYQRWLYENEPKF